MLTKWPDGKAGSGGSRFKLKSLSQPILPGGGPWELLNEHDPSGDIPISIAAQLSVWFQQFNFSDMNFAEFRMAFLDGDGAPPSPVWTDLDTSSLDDTLLNTGDGDDFTESMVGCQLILFSGSTLTPGVYEIVELIDQSTIRVDRPTGGSGGGDGYAKLFSEHQELRSEATRQTVTLTPFIYSASTPVIQSNKIFTIATPGASALRIYLRGEGALTWTKVAVHVTMMPEGSQ